MIRKIKEFTEDYYIRDDGTVYSFKRKGVARKMRPHPNGKGYLRVQFSNRERYFIHRLVANNFLDNLEDLPQVNHIDGNKLNNKVSNLEWCTGKQNLVHAAKLGLLRPNYQPRTTFNKPCKPVRQLDLKGQTIARFPSINAAARALNAQVGNICLALNKNNRTCGGYKWVYDK